MCPAHFELNRVHTYDALDVIGHSMTWVLLVCLFHDLTSGSTSVQQQDHAEFCLQVASVATFGHVRMDAAAQRRKKGRMNE